MKKAIVAIAILLVAGTVFAEPYASFRFGVVEEQSTIWDYREGNTTPVVAVADWELSPFTEIKFGVEWSVFHVWGAVNMRMDPVKPESFERGLFDPQMTWYEFGAEVFPVEWLGLGVYHRCDHDVDAPVSYDRRYGGITEAYVEVRTR